MRNRILVVDDDRDLGILLKAQLERRNHRVTVALNGLEGLRKAYQARPDLVILDVMMPELDGWQVCRRLRELSDVPIIMLTACSAKTDVVKGLKNGADDYVTKPFSVEELEARIQAVLRRGENEGTNGNGRPPYYSNGSLAIDFERRVVKVRGEEIRLTPIEYALLSCLVHNEGRVLPHSYLLTEVWGRDYADRTDYLKMYIRYLRLKIEENPAKPVYIQTEWGIGYRFN